MKTPHAILIGLSLIAAAIFFKDTAVKPAHAFGGPDGFGCDRAHCYVFEGDVVTRFHVFAGLKNTNNNFKANWRTGERLD